uniref:Uncharacterized protein n=1 Tax=Anguilla anguilla TaxID=7936 RepID=A0A0E9WH85_ANGAN
MIIQSNENQREHLTVNCTSQHCSAQPFVCNTELAALPVNYSSAEKEKHLK